MRNFSLRPHGILLLLATFAFMLCASSCAGRADSDSETRVTVSGQYDVSFGVRK